jgi:uncharacterized protein YceH (UPF0502 family)
VLTLEPGERAVIALLLLRGPQTPGELRSRAERLHAFADLAAVHETLEKLIERDYVERRPRRPGQKEERFAHLLGAGEEAAADPIGTQHVAPGDGQRSSQAVASPEEERLERLERELGELRNQVRQLREALGEPAAPQA